VNDEEKRPTGRIRTAYATLDQYAVVNAPAGATFQLDFQNRCIDEGFHKGSAALVVVKPAAAAEVPTSWPASSADLPRFDDVIERINAPLRSMEPLREVMQGIRADSYQSRLVELPAAAYWMSNVDMTEKCAKRILKMVCARRAVQTPFLLLRLEHAAEVLAEFCTALPASMPYMSDVYCNEDKQIAYESFDNLFLRRAGDCEDFACAMSGIFDALRFRGGCWADPDLVRLHEVSKHYMAVSVLGAVSAPSFQAGDDDGIGAHMYVKYVPVDEFYRRCEGAELPTIDIPKHDGGRLPTFIGEGTSEVHVLPTMSLDVQRQEEEATRKASMLPAGYTRLAKACFGTQRGFYKYDVHCFTNYFFEQTRGTALAVPAYFSFFTNDKYGCNISSQHGKIYAHGTLSAPEVHAMRQIMALECPTPILDVPTSPSHQNKFTLPTRSEPSSPRPYRKPRTFFCTTPDEGQRAAFIDYLRKYEPRAKVSCTEELFVRGIKPQFRITIA
jgi:hypothetical protein